MCLPTILERIKMYISRDSNFACLWVHNGHDDDDDDDDDDARQWTGHPDLQGGTLHWTVLTGSPQSTTCTPRHRHRRWCVDRLKFDRISTEKLGTDIGHWLSENLVDWAKPHDSVGRAHIGSAEWRYMFVLRTRTQLGRRSFTSRLQSSGTHLRRSWTQPSSVADSSEMDWKPISSHTWLLWERDATRTFYAKTPLSLHTFNSIVKSFRYIVEYRTAAHHYRSVLGIDRQHGVLHYVVEAPRVGGPDPDPRLPPGAVV